MKKLFLIITMFLLSPVIVFASDIEIKSITSSSDYQDASVEVEDKSTAVINFEVGSKELSKETSYKLVIENNTKKTYNLDFEKLNNENMTLELDSKTLKPGTNNITLNIKRNEINTTFLTNQTITDDVKVVLISDEKSEKVNPNTGYTLIKALIITSNITIIAIVIYNKTKNKSAFFILLLIICIPGFIMAEEDKGFKIKINTIINTDKNIRLCFGQEDYTYKELLYTIKNEDLFLNQKNDELYFEETNDDILPTILLPNEDIRKDNILQKVNELRELKEFFVFEKSKIEKLLSENNMSVNDYIQAMAVKYDASENMLDLFKSEPLSDDLYLLSFIVAITAHLDTYIYDDNKDTLDIVFLFEFEQSVDEYGYRAFKYDGAKISFNKNNDDYVVMIGNSGNTDEDPVMPNSFDEVKESLDNIMSNNSYFPLLNVDKYVNKFKSESDKIIEISEDDGINYIINNQRYNNKEIRNYNFTKEIYYGEYIPDYSYPDEKIVGLYYSPAMKYARNNNTSYLFAIKEDESIINSYKLLNKNYEALGIMPNAFSHYTIIFDKMPACYYINEPS